jgi:hypothetical protein
MSDDEEAHSLHSLNFDDSDESDELFLLIKKKRMLAQQHQKADHEPEEIKHKIFEECKKFMEVTRWYRIDSKPVKQHGHEECFHTKMSMPNEAPY